MVDFITTGNPSRWNISRHRAPLSVYFLGALLPAFCEFIFLYIYELLTLHSM